MVHEASSDDTNLSSPLWLFFGLPRLVTGALAIFDFPVYHNVLYPLSTNITKILDSAVSVSPKFRMLYLSRLYI